jgi:hypothetical protein
MRVILGALALAALAGCASNEGVQLASREETYVPLGTNIPRKNSKTPRDERTYVNKEDFKQAQEMTAEINGPGGR